MAFVRNFNPDDNQSEVTGQTQGISNTPTITSAGATDAIAQQGGVAEPNRQAAGSGTFTNLQRYLAANAAGAENLGTKLSGTLESSRQQAQTGMQTAASEFGTQVSQGTNIFNPDVVNAAAADASSYLSSEDLQRQLSGQYRGPSSYAGSEQDIAAQSDLMAAREKQLLSGSVGGRTQLLRNVLNQPDGAQTSTGGLNLNQFLVQNTQPVYNRLASTAATIEPLAEQYVGQMTTAADQVRQAQEVSSETRRQALERLGAGTTTLQQDINRQLAERQAAADAAAQSQFTTLEAAGATPSQIAAYQTALTAAQQYGGAGVDLANYFTPEVAARLGTADVATAEQVADLAALSQLTGVQNRFLQAGTAGRGPAVDLNTAIGQLQNQEVQGMYAKQLADQQAEFARQQEAQAVEYARQQEALRLQTQAGLDQQAAEYARQQAEIARQQAEYERLLTDQIAAQQAAQDAADRQAQIDLDAAIARQRELEDQIASLLTGGTGGTGGGGTGGTGGTGSTGGAGTGGNFTSTGPGSGADSGPGPGESGAPSSGTSSGISGGVSAGTVGSAIGLFGGMATGIPGLGTISNTTGLSQSIANSINEQTALSNQATVASQMGLTAEQAATPAGIAAVAAGIDATPVGFESTGTTATTGPAGTGAAAAAAASNAADAAAAQGMSDAAIGAASQAAANAAIGGLSPSAAAAAGAAAAAAADAGTGGAGGFGAVGGEGMSAGGGFGAGMGVGESMGAAGGSGMSGVGGFGSEGLGVGSEGEGEGEGAAAGEGEGEGEGQGGGESGGGGGKIICTAMNDMYGLPYRENKVWVKYSATHMKPEHQTGYHKIFLPLVDFAYKQGNNLPNRLVRQALVWIAVNRTQDIEDELAGRNPRAIKRALIRKPAEALIYLIGKWSKK